MEPKQEKILSKFSTSEPLKKMITQLLLSLSIFSFVFSYYSLCSSSQSQPRKLPCLSANPFMNHAVLINKNYLFLICNALLVFLSKTSGLLRSSSGFDLNDMLQKRVGDGILVQTYNNFPTKEPQEGDESHEEYLRGICDDHNFEADEKDTDHSCLLGINEEEEDNIFIDQQVAEEDQALSTEELNKKFDEFIRKTKEEIMMNEARQLVVVKLQRRPMNIVHNVSPGPLSRQRVHREEETEVAFQKGRMNTDITASVKPEYPVIDRNPPFTKTVANFSTLDYLRLSTITGFSVVVGYLSGIKPGIKGPSMVTGGMIGLLGGFMYAYQNSAGRLMGFFPNDGEVAKYKK